MMNDRVVIKKVTIAMMIYFVVAMVFTCLYDTSKPIVEQRWLGALYFNNVNLYPFFLFLIIRSVIKPRSTRTIIIFLNFLLVLSIGLLLFSILHDMHYVYFGEWNDWIDKITIGFFIVSLLIILIWLQTTG